MKKFSIPDGCICGGTIEGTVDTRTASHFVIAECVDCKGIWTLPVEFASSYLVRDTNKTFKGWKLKGKKDATIGFSAYFALLRCLGQ